MLNRQTIEALLDNGELCALMHNGKYYRARRNGKTQTWKTRPLDFRIPIKAGFYACGAINHYSEALDFMSVAALDAAGIKHT